LAAQIDKRGRPDEIVCLIFRTRLAVQQTFDFVVVGGGSTGAVVAARLSEDPSCRVALIEAGDRPPEVELMPIACAAMQKNPATDWMYTVDPGSAGLGFLIAA